MTLTVWKTPLFAGVATYRVPHGARFLSVAFQRNVPHVWFLCDPEAPPEPRILVFTGTGHVVEDIGTLVFIGTMMTEDRAYVFHVFERVSAQL